ncbi:pyridoxamine 5'-phosphate oxidase [Lutibacter sp. TH_r2]|uniref:pyridoxamine 5'-phosphate oxidase n=1 Tax=Lutibacter sp. TH_r2 TaxID=3082083 RepID=UPI002953FB9A|nr:pyridoxamine 5'-phosphate oxidase [Lutibacter sp. TH_r2]MDV7187112.1 pyridoxamine 5'-phosphate oxidase [Lutibacter sp. TH_r2]
MEKDLGNYRKVYQKKELSINEISDNPMEVFQKWFYEVDEFGGDIEPNAMTISTIGLDGIPKSRVVLLKKYTWEGFIFYTNYNSDKGKAIEKNPKVCLSFFWNTIERQIIIQGEAEKISENLSDGYFESRPDGSKLGAWASDQSQPVASRSYLDKRLKDFEEKFEGKEITRPPHWGGYIVRPQTIEFWQGRPNRMHDRIKFTLQENFEWKIERLAP